MPQISVIVPIYKTEEWLEQCVDSVLKQSFENFELLLVDDGSPDNCGKLCDSYAQKDSRINVIHQKNVGLSAARNAGTERALGEYVTYIDSDDYIEPYYLELLYLTICKTGADIAVARFDKVRPAKENLKCLPKPRKPEIESWDSEQACAEMARGRKNSVIACGKLGRRTLYLKHPFETGKLHEDLRHTYLLLHESKKVGFVDAVLYHYVMHGGSITARKKVEEKQCHDYYEAITICTQSLQQWYPKIKLDIDSLIAREYMSVYLMAHRVEKPTSRLKEQQKRIRRWFRKNGIRSAKNSGALTNVRLRTLLMSISPELYRVTYNIGIRFTGKQLG
ncbi:glycosyltransferase family 2 protein [Allofournierella sp.]|uniref:glycosyltransferase family 2 protein n=1 Tax=Allofournierella sp. TaxID=1940256 RepID=UPI003AB1F2BE